MTLANAWTPDRLHDATAEIQTRNAHAFADMNAAWQDMADMGTQLAFAVRAYAAATLAYQTQTRGLAPRDGYREAVAQLAAVLTTIQDETRIELQMAITRAA